MIKFSSKKVLLAAFFLAIVALTSPMKAKAALVHIDTDGSVIMNVLGASDVIALKVPKRQALEVNGNNVDIFREGDSFKLAINDTNLNISNYKDNIIEIEETQQAKKIKISLSGDQFKIEQDGISVLTSFPIEINPKNKEISVKTETGKKFLSILPKEAADSLLRSKIVDSVSPIENSLIEENGILLYQLQGSKTINLFNVSDYKTNIEAKVSASNGEIVFTNEPVWLKFLSFFLSGNK
ncbi:MAG: hypothetical protein AAB546_02860 [Patescibacteria group bacterium]